MEVENSLKNLAAMLRARGDDVTELDEQVAGVDPTDFYGDHWVELHTDQTQVIYTLTKDTLKKFIKEVKDLSGEEMIERWGARRFIVVERPSQTSTVVLVEKDKLLAASDGQLQIYDIRHLIYNPAAHVYTPKHEKISEAEVKDIVDRYQVKTRFQLPIILRADIMARYLGLRHGDVVRIHRHNPNSGTSIYYRCCM